MWSKNEIDLIYMIFKQDNYEIILKCKNEIDHDIYDLSNKITTKKFLCPVSMSCLLNVLFSLY